MHILWDSIQPTITKYYLYVGQSQNIQERVERHENPWNRAKNPSLHYHCWKPGIESIFVVLEHTRETSPLLSTYWSSCAAWSGTWKNTYLLERCGLAATLTLRNHFGRASRKPRRMIMSGRMSSEIDFNTPIHWWRTTIDPWHGMLMRSNT